MYYPVRGQTINKSHDLCKGLMGIWPTNNCTGEILADASGNNIQGVKSGEINYPTWTTGYKNGSTLYFNGAERITVNASEKQPLTANCSLLVWASRDSGSSTNYPCPFNHRSSGNNNTLIGIYLVWSGAIHWWCGGAGGNNTGTGIYQVDTLHCFVITHDSSSVGKLYVDGNLIQTVTGRTWGTTSSSITQFWGQYVTGIYPLTGHVGLSALWNERTLSAEDVKLLYREPFCMFDDGISPANLFVETPGGSEGAGMYHHLQQLGVY